MDMNTFVGSVAIAAVEYAELCIKTNAEFTLIGFANWLKEQP